jgi:chaperonin GroEL (HSP60 family)
MQFSFSQVIVQKLLGQSFEMGYNAMDDIIQNMMESGVIDPTKVTKNGLLNSCSIAGIMLTTQAVMVEKKKASTAEFGMNPAGMPSGMTI